MSIISAKNNHIKMELVMQYWNGILRLQTLLSSHYSPILVASITQQLNLIENAIITLRQL